MKSPMPEFMVSDVQATIKFYEDALGFGNAFTLPDDDGTIVHASVQNGDTMVMLGPFTDGSESSTGALGTGVTLYLSVNEADDIDALFAVAEKAGAKVLQTPHDAFWGDRIWSVADPDGYKIVVLKQVQEVSIEDMTKAASTMAAPV